MSRFFFKGSTASEPEKNSAAEEQPDIAAAVNALAEIHAITASAIFAKLVSKGVLSADEAAEYMGDIAQALQHDVRSSVTATAANLLRAYGQALSAAEKEEPLNGST